MGTKSDAESTPPPPDWVVSPPDEFHPYWVGNGWFQVAKFYAPKPAEVRSMLLALRKKFRWPKTFAAQVFGVTTSALEKWEVGDRDPNGAAAKLIFLLYSQLVDSTNNVRNVWDLAWWGKVPCRDSINLLIAFSGTYFLPRDVVLKWVDAAEAAEAEKLAANQGSSADPANSHAPAAP
jgi:hypothetical protein